MGPRQQKLIAYIRTNGETKLMKLIQVFHFWSDATDKKQHFDDVSKLVAGILKKLIREGVLDEVRPSVYDITRDAKEDRAEVNLNQTTLF